jgi:hypothetical protein
MNFVYGQCNPLSKHVRFLGGFFSRRRGFPILVDELDPGGIERVAKR